MKLGIILSTKNEETNWNALRLANLALSKGDTVSIFLISEGVEYQLASSPKFNIKEQVEKLFARLMERTPKYYEYKQRWTASNNG